MENVTKEYFSAAKRFLPDCQVTDVRPYGEGHINKTLLVTTPDNIYTDWLGGSVKVEYHTADTVTLAESGAKNDDMRLRWKLTDDNSLFVKYCAPRSRVVVGVGKKLTLTLPENFRATNIEFDTVAASVTTAVLSAQKTTVRAYVRKIIIQTLKK